MALSGDARTTLHIRPVPKPRRMAGGMGGNMKVARGQVGKQAFLDLKLFLKCMRIPSCVLTAGNAKTSATQMLLRGTVK